MNYNVISYFFLFHNYFEYQLTRVCCNFLDYSLLVNDLRKFISIYFNVSAHLGFMKKFLLMFFRVVKSPSSLLYSPSFVFTNSEFVLKLLKLDFNIINLYIRCLNNLKFYVYFKKVRFINYCFLFILNFSYVLFIMKYLSFILKDQEKSPGFLVLVKNYYFCRLIFDDFCLIFDKKFDVKHLFLFIFRLNKLLFRVNQNLKSLAFSLFQSLPCDLFIFDLSDFVFLKKGFLLHNNFLLFFNNLFCIFLIYLNKFLNLEIYEGDLFCFDIDLFSSFDYYYSGYVSKIKDFSSSNILISVFDYLHFFAIYFELLVCRVVVLNVDVLDVMKLLSKYDLQQFNNEIFCNLILDIFNSFLELVNKLKE